MQSAGGSFGGLPFFVSVQILPLRLQPTRLDVVRNSGDMKAPGWKLHPLKGKLQGAWAVGLDQNVRLIFRFEGEDVYDVDSRDYP